MFLNLRLRGSVRPLAHSRSPFAKIISINLVCGLLTAANGSGWAGSSATAISPSAEAPSIPLTWIGKALMELDTLVFFWPRETPVILSNPSPHHVEIVASMPWNEISCADVAENSTELSERASVTLIHKTTHA